MSADPEDEATGPEEGPGVGVDGPEAPAGPATLGEILESSHGRFVARVRERQRKGELE